MISLVDTWAASSVGALALALALAKDTTGRARPLLFFFCLGAAFVFVEVALMQHFVMFLGHPVYALSTVLVALLLRAGIGSVLTARVLPIDATTSARKRARTLVAALVVYSLVLGAVLDKTVSLPFAARLLVTLVLLAPLGLLMGSQAPLGVKILSIHTPELIPWCWGLFSPRDTESTPPDHWRQRVLPRSSRQSGAEVATLERADLSGEAGAAVAGHRHRGPEAGRRAALVTDGAVGRAAALCAAVRRPARGGGRAAVALGFGLGDRGAGAAADGERQREDQERGARVHGSGER